MISSSEPPYPAKALANTLLDWAAGKGTDVTPLKMQKLLYFMHADFLVRTGGPLIRETFEAWSYGPVIPSVYEQFKRFSRQKITMKAAVFDPRTRLTVVPHLEMPDEIKREIEATFLLYLYVDAGLLSGMSHRANGPWDQALRKFNANQNINRSISNDLIRSAHSLSAA